MTAHVAIQTAVIAVIAVTGSDGGSLGDSCPLYARGAGCDGSDGAKTIETSRGRYARRSRRTP